MLDSQPLLLSLLTVLLFTRAGIVRRYIHTPILQLADRKGWDYDFIDEGLKCPMCTGWWVTIALSLAFQTGFWYWVALYLAVVFLMALYDFLTHRD